MKYKDLWQSSKVLLIPSEEIDQKVTGYIIGNLLKHKEVSTFDELYNNPFSNYKHLADQYGKEFVNDLIYQVININENSEGEVDLNVSEAEASKPSAEAG